MTMTLRRTPPAVAISLIGLVAGACALADTEPTCEPQNSIPGCDQVLITVNVRNWETIGEIDYSVEMVGSAWPIDAAEGGGVFSGDAPNGAEVVMYRTPDCRVMMRFHADPRSAWLVEVSDDGVDVRMRDAGEAVEMGPGIEEGAVSGCE